MMGRQQSGAKAVNRRALNDARRCSRKPSGSRSARGHNIPIHGPSVSFLKIERNNFITFLQ